MSPCFGGVFQFMKDLTFFVESITFVSNFLLTELSQSGILFSGYDGEDM